MIMMNYYYFNINVKGETIPQYGEISVADLNNWCFWAISLYVGERRWIVPGTLNYEDFGDC